MSGTKLKAVSWLACNVLPSSEFGAVIFTAGQGVVWEIMVSVREDRNISMLDVYSRALRPALSIRLAATATERRRTAPTMAASYLKATE